MTLRWVLWILFQISPTRTPPNRTKIQGYVQQVHTGEYFFIANQRYLKYGSSINLVWSNIKIYMDFLRICYSAVTKSCVRRAYVWLSRWQCYTCQPPSSVRLREWTHFLVSRLLRLSFIKRLLVIELPRLSRGKVREPAPEVGNRI